KVVNISLQTVDECRHSLTCLFRIRLTVQKPLSFRALDSFYHAFAVAYPAVLPPERELVAIAMKVLLTQLVEYTVVAAFQEGEERFSRVGVHPDIIRVDAAVFP